MKTKAIRLALAQYLHSGPDASPHVRRALEEVEAIEAAQTVQECPPEATDAALVEQYRRTHPEDQGKVTIGEALAAMRKQEVDRLTGIPDYVRAQRTTAYPDAKVRTGPMCKATKGTGSGYDICWREEGHREGHDFRPGVVRVITYASGMAGGPMKETTRVETGCPCIGLLHDVDCPKLAQSSPHRCPHDNVGCGTTRICEVCKGETKHVCTIRCTGLGAIQCPKAGGR